MTSTLFVEELKGRTTGTNANKVIVPSGQTLEVPTVTGNPSFTGGLKVDTVQNTSGTTGITIDSGGRILKPTQVFVRATGNSTRHNQTSANTEQSLDYVANDDNTSSFNPTGGIFTAPIAGRYFIHYFASMKSNTSYIQLYVKHNSTIVATDYNELPNANADWSCHQVTIVLNMAANDTTQPFMVSGGTNAFALELYYRGCSMYLLG